MGWRGIHNEIVAVVVSELGVDNGNQQSRIYF